MSINIPLLKATPTPVRGVTKKFSTTSRYSAIHHTHDTITTTQLPIRKTTPKEKQTSLIPATTSSPEELTTTQPSFWVIEVSISHLQ